MSTMAEVARRAGVSVATVSHVLNRTRTVSDSTRETVLAAIQETGYVPNRLARSLVTARTQTIGLCISAISNPYFAEVVQGIEAEATRNGYTLLLSDTREDPDRELQTAHMLGERRVDGVILAASPDPWRALEDLRRQGVPVVLIDRLVSPDHDGVGPENVEATASLVGHLAELDHRRIGMVSGLDALATTMERLRGYELGLRRAGLALDPVLVAGGASDAEPARRAVHALLALPDPPTALVVGNNHMTIGALRALKEAGREVPGDLALVAFDDLEWADLFTPRLTTMAQPGREIGAQAVELLLSRLRDAHRPPRSMRLAPELRHRDSCGCSS